MRAWPCQLAVLGLLVMGFEGVADMSLLADALGGHDAHDGAETLHGPAHGAGDAGSEADPDEFDPDHHHHCGHSCHGHVANFGIIALAVEAQGAQRRDAFTAPHLSNRTHAPPTPPPNA